MIFNAARGRKKRRAIDRAQVAIPAEGNHLHDDDPVVEWDPAEVDKLDKRPYHPVPLQRREVRLLQLLLRIRALHDGHGAQEDAETHGRKCGLVYGDTCDHFNVFVLEDDSGLEELEPSRGHWTPYRCVR